jgi:hypothetical protein
MDTKTAIINSSRIGEKVKKTQAFLALNKAQRDIASTGQNITAIGKGIAAVKLNGFLHWETFSQNSRNNTEIIREIYANSLEVKF